MFDDSNIKFTRGLFFIGILFFLATLFMSLSRIDDSEYTTVESSFTITEKRVEVFKPDISPIESLLFATDGRDYITDFTNNELTLSINSSDIYNELQVGDTVDCVIKYNVEDTTDTKLISYTKVDN